MNKTPTPTALSKQELTDFEAWAARRGYNTRREGHRYCHVALNDIHAAVVEFKRASTASALPAKQEPAVAASTYLESRIPNWDLPPIVHGPVSVIPSLSCSHISTPTFSPVAPAVDLRPHLAWALRRISTSLGEGEYFAAAQQALDASETATSQAPAASYGKPSWGSHTWPQIVQDSEGNWYGVKAGWTMSVAGEWEGDKLWLLREDGEFLQRGPYSPEWRASLEQRPKPAATPSQKPATQLAGGAHYSLDADPEGIRARVADAITGALAIGAQGGEAPPADHWLTPFWMAARFEAAQLNAMSKVMNALTAPAQEAAPALEAPAAPMTHAEAAAALAINAALCRIRAGNAAGAIEPLEQGLAALAAAPQAPAAPAVHALPQAVRDVLAERARQMERKGYDTEHDDSHELGEIGALAALYLMPQGARDWDASSTGYGDTLGEALLPADWTVPQMGKDTRQDVVKGLATGLAELERIDRAAIAAQAKGDAT